MKKSFLFLLFLLNFALAQTNKSPTADQVCFNNIDETNFTFVATNFFVTKDINSTLNNGLPVVDISKNCFTIYSDLKPSNSVFNKVVNLMGWNGVQGPSPTPAIIDNPSSMPDQTNMAFATNIYPYCSDINTDYKNITCNTLDFAVGGIMSFGYKGVTYTCPNVIFAEGSYYNNNNNFSKAKNIWSGYGNTETPDSVPASAYMIECSDANSNQKAFYINSNPDTYNQFSITDNL